MGKSFVLDVLCLPSNKGFKIVIRGDRYKAVERQGEACLIVGTEIGKEIVRRDHEMVLRYLDDHMQIVDEEMV